MQHLCYDINIVISYIDITIPSRGRTFLRKRPKTPEIIEICPKTLISLSAKIPASQRLVKNWPKWRKTAKKRQNPVRKSVPKSAPKSTQKLTKSGLKSREGGPKPTSKTAKWWSYGEIGSKILEIDPKSQVSQKVLKKVGQKNRFFGGFWRPNLTEILAQDL